MPQIKVCSPLQYKGRREKNTGYRPSIYRRNHSIIYRVGRGLGLTLVQLPTQDRNLSTDPDTDCPILDKSDSLQAALWQGWKEMKKNQEEVCLVNNLHHTGIIRKPSISIVGKGGLYLEVVELYHFLVDQNTSPSEQRPTLLMPKENSCGKQGLERRGILTTASRS